MQTSRDCLHHLKRLAVAARQKPIRRRREQKQQQQRRQQQRHARARCDSANKSGLLAPSKSVALSPYFVKGWTKGALSPLFPEG